MKTVSIRMRTVTRSALIIVAATGICVAPRVALTADGKISDIGMFLFNYEKPFVSRGFAEQLGRLVMSEKFKEAVLAAGSPDVQDKDEVWLVTFKVVEWKIPEGLRPLAASQVSLTIRKSDGAVVAIK